jgi:hypothetical protein
MDGICGTPKRDDTCIQNFKQKSGKKLRDHLGCLGIDNFKYLFFHYFVLVPCLMAFSDNIHTSEVAFFLLMNLQKKKCPISGDFPINSILINYNVPCGGPGLILGQVVWDLRWKKWIPLGCSKYLFPLPILTSPTAPHSLILLSPMLHRLDNNRVSK